MKSSKKIFIYRESKFNNLNIQKYINKKMPQRSIEFISKLISKILYSRGT